MLLALLVLVPLSSAGTYEGLESAPGWLLFDYVGGVEDGSAETTAFLHGPGAAGVELRYRVPGYPYLVGNSATVIRAGGPDAAAGPLGVAPPSVPFATAAGISLFGGVEGRLLVWSASADDAWSWSVSLPADAQLTLVGRGDGALFMLGDGADSGAHAHVTLGASASVSSDARYELPIRHNFVGEVGLNPGGQWLRDQVTLRLPSGDVLDCPCAPVPTNEWLNGDYEIGWDGVGVGPDTLLVVGVDVEGLPEFDWPES